MLRFTSVASFRSTNAFFAQVVPYLLADIGEGILEVEVKEWFVKPGDTVKQFQPLCEVQSDKATAPISSRYDGVIKKLYVEQNGIAKVGEPIVDIETDAVIAPSSGSKAKPSETKSSDKKQPASSSTSSNNKSSSSNNNNNNSSPSNSGSGKAKIVPYPLADIGEGILEVEVKEWFVKPGDHVKQFDDLCEVQSDKATVKISSRYDGIVRKLYVELNGTAAVGEPIVDIETEANVAPSSGSQVKKSTNNNEQKSNDNNNNTSTNNNNNNQQQQQQPAAHGGKALCPPSVRRIAAENNINLLMVPATGKGGRVITKGDILEYIKNGGKTSTSTTSDAQQTANNTTQSSSSSSAVTRQFGTPEDKAIKITGVRRIMVQSMTKANNIPAFGACDEIEISSLTRTRDNMRASFAKRYAQEFPTEAKSRPLKLSFMPFFLKAASLGLAQYPEINSHTNDDCTVLTVKGSHNIGFAMDTPQGLLVPVIRDVQNKSLFDIAVDLQGLMERAAKGSIGTSELQGATFTLSNIGSIGGTYMTPVVNPPTVAIGALGRGRVVPRYDADGKIFPANIVEVSWSADHRVVDGASMVRFSNSFREFLEKPETMLGWMR